MTFFDRSKRIIHNSFGQCWKMATVESDKLGEDLKYVCRTFSVEGLICAVCIFTQFFLVLIWHGAPLTWYQYTCFIDSSERTEGFHEYLTQFSDTRCCMSLLISQPQKQ